MKSEQSKSRGDSRRSIRVLTSFFTANWGLKLLALLLAVVIYHTLKPGSGHDNFKKNDQRIFNYR